MRIPLFLLLTVIANCTIAQSDYSSHLKSITSTHCLGTTLLVTSSHALSTIIWIRDGIPVATTHGVSSYASNGRIVAGGHGAGSAPDQVNPWALHVDSANNLFVGDLVGRVQKWSPGASAGVTVAGGSSPGTGAGALSVDVRGIDLDTAGNLYVADQDNQRIQKWAPGATVGITVAGGHGRGDGAGQLNDPFGVTSTSNGDLYVADELNHRIQKWSPGVAEGVTVIGGYNGGASYVLNGPWSTSFDGKGNMYILDDGGTVSVLAAGVMTVTHLPLSANGASACFVDHGGNVYVVNAVDGVIQEWVNGAASWSTIIDTHFKPTNSVFVSNYQGICLDQRGNVYVSDGSYLRVLEFDRNNTIDSTYIPAGAGIYTAEVIDIFGDTTTSNPFLVTNPFSGPLPTVTIQATATNTPVCTPIAFSADASTGGAINPTFQWQVSGVDVGGDSTHYSNNLFANGDQIRCIMTSDTGCSATPLQDTSNVITLAIDPQGHASLTISASDTAVCKGTPIIFTAAVSNGTSNPGFDWRVNGVSTGDTGSTYIDSTAAGDQVVYCLITSDASCGLAKSNSIPVTIYPVPSVAPDQVFNIPYGKSGALQPIVTGDIATCNWKPATGLSDPTILDPVATITGTTTYELTVTSYGGCKASGSITVEVYTPLSVPNAFTPNGDGHNDRFYVLGGPSNSMVEDIAVFNRYGMEVFHAHNVAPGDNSHAWDGSTHGSPAPPGTYVYLVVMRMAGGTRQVYKGTVMLIR